MDLKSKIILISGPTASGKSNFAIKLAKKINGDIPKNVVTEVKTIGLARTLHASIVASILFLPSLRSFFKKSIRIRESLTTIPIKANKPITERNCKL